VSVSALASQLATPIASRAAPPRRPINIASTAGLSTPSRPEKCSGRPKNETESGQHLDNGHGNQEQLSVPRIHRPCPLEIFAPPRLPAAGRHLHTAAHGIMPHSNILFKTGAAIFSMKALRAC